MKIAYLILAHNMPEHLQRLVTALSSDSSSIFIHIDKKSDIDNFSNIKGKSVRFTQERVAVFWGDFSQVEATLVLLQSALADSCRFDRFVLLSGADYPLQAVSYIEKFFEKNRDREFMNLVAMPSETAKKPISLLTTYRVRPGNALINRIVQKIFLKIGVLPTRRDYKLYLRDLAPYAGATWWALSREACELVQSFVIQEKNVVGFFKNVICPDESFFQTILGNSDFKPKIVRSLTYADWSAGGANPATINEKHLGLFRATPSFMVNGDEILFARKFPNDSAALISQLNEAE